MIRCCMAGRRTYSHDLPQGGLEIPCVLLLEGRYKKFETTTEALTHLVTFYCTMYPTINSTSLSTVLSLCTVCLLLNESMACGPISALKKTC